MSVLTPLPGAQPRDCSWLRGAAGRVRLQDALRTQLQLLLAKKGRVTAGQLDPPRLSSHAPCLRGPCPARPPPRAAVCGTSALASAGRCGETSEGAIVRPARRARSCHPAMRDARGRGGAMS